MSEWRGTGFAIFERTPERVAEIGADGVTPLPHPPDFPDQVAHDQSRDHPDQLRFDAIHKTWLGFLEQTGDTAPLEKRQEADQRAEVLEQQNRAIAAGLERVWYPVYQQTEFEIVAVGRWTKAHRKLPPYRRIMILPEVAKKIRHKMLRNVEYWLQENRHDQMCVFTSDVRTLNGDETRDQQREEARRISRLNSEVLMPRRVQIQLATSELGTMKRDAEGNATWHVHTHAILHHMDGRPLPHAKSDTDPEFGTWEECMQAIWRWWAPKDATGQRTGWWGKGDDKGNTGIIRQARETVKYLAKPGDVLALSDPEKATLAWSQRRSKNVRPMGQLRDEIRRRREHCLRIERREGILCEVLDWDRWDKPCFAKKSQEWRESVAEMLLAAENRFRRRQGLPEFKNPLRLREPRQWAAEDTETALQHVARSTGGDVTSRDPECVIVARPPPSFMRGSMIREPYFVVRVPVGTPVDKIHAFLESHPWWIEAGQHTEANWLAGKAAAKFLTDPAAAAAGIRVHTCTPTVGTELPGFEVSRVLESRPIPRPASASSV